MNKALGLGAAVLALSAATASAQAVNPSRNYGPYNYGYVAVSPLYDYAPASMPGPRGYGALVFTAPLYVPSPSYPAPPAEPGYYTAQSIVVSQPLYDYTPRYWGALGPADTVAACAHSAPFVAERRCVFGVYVAKGQRLLLRGNAAVEYAFCSLALLDANCSRGHVGMEGGV